jgi:DNA polymerase-3 subunit epsilon
MIPTESNKRERETMLRSICFVDCETTGLDPNYHEIIEVAAVRVLPTSLIVEAEMEAKIIPQHIERASDIALEINGYTPERWVNAIPLEKALRMLRPIISGCYLAGHNVRFDFGFLKEAFTQCKLEGPAVDYHFVDTCSLAWPLFVSGQVSSRKLKTLCDYFDVTQEGAHTAMGDVRRTIEVYKKLMNMFHLPE